MSKPIEGGIGYEEKKSRNAPMLQRLFELGANGDFGGRKAYPLSVAGSPVSLRPTGRQLRALAAKTFGG
jgi:hypothetical protein